MSRIFSPIPKADRHPDDWLVPRQAAADYAPLLTESWLAHARVGGYGPAFGKLRGRIYYRRRVIEDFLAGRQRRSTSEAA